MSYIEKELENDRKFTENFIKDIHERTTLDCQPRIEELIELHQYIFRDL